MSRDKGRGSNDRVSLYHCTLCLCLCSLYVAAGAGIDEAEGARTVEDETVGAGIDGAETDEAEVEGAMIETEGSEGAGIDEAEGAGTAGDAAEVEGAEREREWQSRGRGSGTGRSSRGQGQGQGVVAVGSVVGICVVCGSYLIRKSRSLSRTQDCGMWGRVRRRRRRCRCCNRFTQLEIYTV